tara:strand:- start:953 stop:1837 length:885 start_codon:yes stop_codon:yes gene_type:complete
MATVFYDKAMVNVSFDGLNENILASDCTINLSSSQQPLYSIGTKGSLGQFPTAARVGDISFNFITSITGAYNGYKGNLINYLASGVKHSVNSQCTGVHIECAGITGVGYLNSYSFNVGSNIISTSSAAFTLYGSGTAEEPVSGFIHGGAPAGCVGIGVTASLATGIAHGKTSDISALETSISNPTDTANIFAADYSLSLNHNPIYKVGQELPLTTLYTTAAESVNVTEDVFNNALKFNESSANYTLKLRGFNAAGGNGTEAMEVMISGGKQISTSASAGLDDIIRTQKTINAAY